MKYCIVTNEKKINMKNIKAFCFLQWLNVFKGSLLSLNEFLESLNKTSYDIVHINLSNKNISMIEEIRNKIGYHSKTKIIITMDVKEKYWKKEFGSYSLIKSSLKYADLILATDYKKVKKLEKIINKNVYEIPHPADIDKIKKYKVMKRKKTVTILFNPNLNKIIKIDKLLKKCFEYETRILCYKIDEKNISILRNKKLNIIECENEKTLVSILSESEFIIAPGEHKDYKMIILYSAVLGIPVVGNDSMESQLRCFPFIINYTGKILNYLGPIWWLSENDGGKEFMSRNAEVKAEYYNWENIKKKIMQLLFYKFNEQKYKYKIVKPEIKTNIINFSNEIFHIYGNKNIQLTKKDFAVFCLVKNGMEYVQDYVRHYSSLGARHIFFIDNGSTDGTVQRLKKFENVTIYSTELEHKKFECEMRKAVIEEHCMGSWCLYADADEFFDYPFSDKISMKQLIEYLNMNGFTSVIAYMLDMFPDEYNFNNLDKNENIINDYYYYDISQIKKRKYFSHRSALCNYNVLSDKSMKNYYGGIRDRHFKIDDVEYLLIKHPLMFLDGKLDVMTDPHYCNKSYVADINGVLRHYKITNSFKEKINRDKENFAYFGMKQNEAYSNVLENRKEFKIKTAVSKRYSNVNDLIKSKYIKVSRMFKKYADKCSYVN